MATTLSHNIKSLTAAVKPGIESLVARELESMITEAVIEAQKKIRAELTERCKLKLQSSLEKSMMDNGIDIRVDCTLGGKDES